MPATPSEGRQNRLALRIALAFSGALALAEAADLGLTFIAPLVAAALAAGPGPSTALLVALPLGAWVLVIAVAMLVEVFAGSAPLVFGTVLVLGLWTGFRMSLRPGGAAVFGLLALIFFAIAPMRLLAAPEAAEVVVNDVGRNVLVGTAVAWLIGLLVQGPDAPARKAQLVAPLPPLTAALVTALAAWLVWVYEPPAPAAVLIGVIITLRAGPLPGISVVRDRFGAALIGGAAAVLTVTVLTVAPVLPVLFLVLLSLAFALARPVAAHGAASALAMKSLNALAILVAEGYSPLFEDTEERLWIRIVGVLVGLLYASLALALLARREGLRASLPSAPFAPSRAE